VSAPARFCASSHRGCAVCFSFAPQLAVVPEQDVDLLKACVLANVVHARTELDGALASRLVCMMFDGLALGLRCWRARLSAFQTPCSECFPAITWSVRPLKARFVTDPHGRVRTTPLNRIEVGNAPRVTWTACDPGPTCVMWLTRSAPRCRQCLSEAGAGLILWIPPSPVARLAATSPLTCCSQAWGLGLFGEALVLVTLCPGKGALDSTVQPPLLLAACT